MAPLEGSCQFGILKNTKLTERCVQVLPSYDQLPFSPLRQPYGCHLPQGEAFIPSATSTLIGDARWT